jgi:hypothetical protein
MSYKIKIPAIYQIRNVLDGNIYVGSTKSFDQRMQSHLHELRAGIHHSYKLQKAWDDYFPPAFSFEIIELTISDEKKRLREREQFYIDLMKPFYNICLDSSTSKNTLRSNKTKFLISLKAKGRFQPSGKDDSNSKAIYQWDLRGNFIKRFDCISDAKRAGFGEVTHICACCKGKKNSYHGYKYTYADKILSFEKKREIADQVTGNVDDVDVNVVDNFINLFNQK